MGLFNKLKEILFDEETVEIPVITKEDKKSEEKAKKSSQNAEPEKRRAHDDEVIIKKIETPKRETSNVSDIKEDTLYDMPKFKSEDQKDRPAENKEKINTFTFPVFDDDISERRVDKKHKEKEHEEQPKKKTVPVEKETKERNTGYTNAYDYSYGKYKGDYMSSRESAHEYVAKTLEEKEEKKSFTPSPIISPVYGVLNENYKKEDIISKSEKRSSSTEYLDLDSVRRKAYGTLEDELEATMNNVEEEKDEYFALDEPDETLDDEGISIDDLLAEDAPTTVEEEPTITVEEQKQEDDTELFDVLGDDDEEEIIDIEEKPKTDDLLRDTRKIEPLKVRRPDLSTPVSGPRIPDDVEELKMHDNEDKESAIGEEDLFDLIDSLYEGKGEE